jgi:hypothetical protein
VIFNFRAFVIDFGFGAINAEESTSDEIVAMLVHHRGLAVHERVGLA